MSTAGQMCQPSALSLWRQTAGEDKKGLKAQPGNVHALQRQSQGGATLNILGTCTGVWEKFTVHKGAVVLGGSPGPGERWELTPSTQKADILCHVMIISLSCHVSIISYHMNMIYENCTKEREQRYQKARTRMKNKIPWQTQESRQLSGIAH